MGERGKRLIRTWNLGHFLWKRKILQDGLNSNFEKCNGTRNRKLKACTKSNSYLHGNNDVILIFDI